jgi:hypothetical protein
LQASAANAERSEVETAPAANPKLNKNWRFYSGITALVLAAVAPLGSLLVPFLGLPTAWAVTVAAGCIAGLPEVLLLAAAALLGKETMHYFLAAAKNWFLGLFFRNETAKTSTCEIPSWNCPLGFSLVMEPDRQWMQTVAKGRWC